MVFIFAISSPHKSCCLSLAIAGSNNIGNQRCRDLRLPCDGRLDDFRQSLLLSCDEAELAVEFRPGRLDDFRQSLLLSCDEAELAVEFRPGRPV